MTTAVTPTTIRLPNWAKIVFGLLSVAAGIAALVWPGITVLVLVALLGIQILVYGILGVITAFETGQARILAVIMGVLSLLAGTALLLSPLRNVEAVLVVLAAFWVVGGLIQAIGALIERDEGWGFEVFLGVITLISGILMVVWPGVTLLVVAIMAGIWMIVVGLAWLVSAFQNWGRTASAV